MAPIIMHNGNESGLIACAVYTDGVFNKYKSFTIDTGMVIDKRVKMFPAIIDCGFENLNAYPVLIESKDHKKKFNEPLFRQMFKGGIYVIDTFKPMYTDEYIELNKNVALITMPTDKIDRELKNLIRNTLLKALNNGVFAEAKNIDPNSRFVFKYLDEYKNFTLTNKGVGAFYGAPCSSTIEVEINFNTTPEGKYRVIINTISKKS